MYKFYEDPGHGWLRVDKRELQVLKIDDKISSFSYMDEKYAYLEEDSDLSLFADAKKINVTRERLQMFWNSECISEHQEDCFIRNLNRYKN